LALRSVSWGEGGLEGKDVLVGWKAVKWGKHVLHLCNVVDGEVTYEDSYASDIRGSKL